MIGCRQDFKKTQKITWLAESKVAPFTPTVCVQFDHIISKAVLGKDDDFKQFINSNTRVCSCSCFLSSCCGCSSVRYARLESYNWLAYFIITYRILEYYYNCCYSFHVRYFRAYAGQTFSPWCHITTSLGPLLSLALAPYPSYLHSIALFKSSLTCPYLCCVPLPSSYKRSLNHQPPSARHARTSSIPLPRLITSTTPSIPSLHLSSTVRTLSLHFILLMKWYRKNEQREVAICSSWLKANRKTTCWTSKATMAGQYRKGFEKS